MSNGSWENIYINQGRVQIEVLDTAKKAVKIFKDKKYKEILDLGCGTGRHSLFLAQNEFNVSACDISQEAIDITSKLGKEYGLSAFITTSIQDMYSLTYDSNKFDGILCLWVQGHGTKIQIQDGIDESYRVLKNDGMIITDYVTTRDPTYGVGTQIEKNTFVGGREGEENIPHYYTTKKEIEEMYKQFRSVRLEDKIYEFKAPDGTKHQIDALIVYALK